MSGQTLQVEPAATTLRVANKMVKYWQTLQVPAMKTMNSMDAVTLGSCSLVTLVIFCREGVTKNPLNL